MKKIQIVLLLALLGYAAPPPDSNPGVVYEIETTDHSASPPRTEESTVSVEGRNLKIASGVADRGDGDMIFRGDRGKHGEMVVVDHDDKSYYVMDDEAISELARTVGDAMKQVEEALKNVPANQREMMEKMLKERMGAGQEKSRPKIEIRNTGERASKNGYPCVKYEVYKDDKKTREIWTTDWKNVEGGDEAAEAFRAMSGFFEALWKAIPSMPGGEDPFGGFDEMNFENGFPVVTRGFDDGGGLEDESTLRSARRRTLDPAEFEPPAGYKRRSMGPQ